MKCTRCGADTRVLETRALGNWQTMRRHQCFNGCRPFKTFEMPISAVSTAKRRWGEAFRTFQKRRELWHRDRAILKMLERGVKGSRVAEMFGIAYKTVSVIKWRFKEKRK